MIFLLSLSSLQLLLLSPSPPILLLFCIERISALYTSYMVYKPLDLLVRSHSVCEFVYLSVSLNSLRLFPFLPLSVFVCLFLFLSISMCLPTILLLLLLLLLFFQSAIVFVDCTFFFSPLSKYLYSSLYLSFGISVVFPRILLACDRECFHDFLRILLLHNCFGNVS